MLELGEEPKRLVSTFLRYRNDIDIYTEDEQKDKEFYRVLFTRLLAGKIRINDITPLGSKKNILERCENEPPSDRKKIFIIDGDIGVIHRQNIPLLKNLFVLDAYCIENLVLDKESIIHFIYLNCASKPKEQIEAECDFDVWLTVYSEKLIDLFLHLALIDLFGGKYTLFNAHRYHDKNDFIVQLVEKDIKSLKAEILNLTSVENYETKYGELRALWSFSIENLLQVVSGKDYLIPLLLFKTQHFKKSRALPTVEETKFFLAQVCNLNRLSKLKSAIEAL